MTRITRFNPQKMDDNDVLSLATGREILMESTLDDMKRCLSGSGNIHFVIFGPRGMGKSFFTKWLQIKHDLSEDFRGKSIFIQFPEEQNNIQYVADILDMLSAKLEGKNFNTVLSRWTISDTEFLKSKRRFEKVMSDIKKQSGIQHVFFSMENLQDFILKMESNPEENARLREVLEGYENLTLIGTSLRPDIDSDYDKMLFQVFKKIDLKPWGEKEFVEYYRKTADNKKLNKDIVQLNVNKIRAIVQFSGGSPRLAVILKSLIIENDVLTTLEILNGIIDELTPYYQDLTKDIPPKSRVLFDQLIRLGENVTQTELASKLNPPQEQNAISRSFKWLLDNFYVASIKQKKTNVKLYYVPDRIYILYYQNREVMADQRFSFIDSFVGMLTGYYSQSELLSMFECIDGDHPFSKPLLLFYSKRLDIEIDRGLEFGRMKEVLFKSIEIQKLRTDLDYFKTIIKGNSENRIEIIEKRDKSLRESYDWNLLAISYYESRQYVKAINSINESLKLDNISYDLYLILASSYFYNKQFDESIEASKQALKLEPNNDFLGNYILASSYLIKKEYNEAEKYYLSTLKNNSTLKDVYYGLSLIYILKNRIEDAENILTQALENNIEDFIIYDQLGDLYYLKENYYEGIGSFKKAIEADTASSSLLQKIGFGYTKLKEFDNAYMYFKEALKIDNQSDQALGNVLIRYYFNFEFDKLDLLFSEFPNANFSTMLGRSLAHCIKNKNLEIFLKTIDWVIEKHPDYLNSMISSLCTALYDTEKLSELEDVIDELKRRIKDNQTIKVMLQAWEYLLNPESKDIAALHPDARIAALAILEDRKGKKDRKK